MRFLTLLFASSLLSGTAMAQDISSGVFAVDYGEEGLWNDSTTGDGLMYDGAEITSWGSPWTVMSMYSAQTGDLEAISTYSSDFDLLAFDVFSGIDDPAGYFSTTAGSVGVYYAGDVQIVKRESWDVSGHLMRIDVALTNLGCEDLDKVLFMHAVDPDQDMTGSPTSYKTINDTTAAGRVVYSQGDNTNITVGYGICNDQQEVGHSNWDSTASTAVLSDDQEAIADRTMHIRQTIGTLGAGSTETFSFVFVAHDSDADAVEAYYEGYFGGVCPASCDEDMTVVKEEYYSDLADMKTRKASESKSKSSESASGNAIIEASTKATSETKR